MTYYRIKSTSQKMSFILQKSNYFYSHDDNSSDRASLPRQLSEVGTESYQRSLRRAFSRAKLIAFFNPDLTRFVTLTYRKNDNTPQEVVYDIKVLIKNHNNNSTTPLKYIYVMERQKRGSIHVHMVCNESIITKRTPKGFGVKHWPHGFSDVRSIKDFDKNFRPYLYLFKYMSKAQRVGASFIHASRNFDKIEMLDYADYINSITGEELIHSESHAFTISNKKYRIDKEYYRKKTQANY